MKILALVLAGGEGSRIKPLLSEDEKIKPMLKVGEKRLVEVALDSLEGLDVEKAVLTFPDEKYHAMNKLVESRGIKVITQKAKHRKLPTMLELPYLLLNQFHFSKDKKWLQGFDSILTMPCDLIFNKEDLAGLVKIHREEFIPRLKKRITVLSKLREEGESGDNFTLDGTRITGFKRFKGETPKGWLRTHQAGIFILSKAFIKNPLPFFLGPKHFHGQMFLTKNRWDDYGSYENVKKLKGL